MKTVDSWFLVHRCSCELSRLRGGRSLWERPASIKNLRFRTVRQGQIVDALSWSCFTRQGQGGELAFAFGPLRLSVSLIGQLRFSPLLAAFWAYSCDR